MEFSVFHDDVISEVCDELPFKVNIASARYLSFMLSDSAAGESL